MRDRAAGAAPELHDSTDADPVTSPAAPCASPYTRDSTPESHRYPASGVPEHEPHPGSDAVHMSPSFIQRSVARYLKSNVVPTLEELVAFHRDGVINVDASCLKLDMDSAEREYLEYERTLRRELEKEERNIDSKSRAVLLNVKTSSIRISNLTETIEVYSLKKKRRLERLTSEKELCFPSQMRIGMIELDIEVLGTDIRQFEERRDALIKSLREQEAEYQTLLDSLIQFRIQRKLKEAELDGVRDKELYLRKVLLFLQAAGADVDIGPDGRVAIHGLDAIGKTAPRSAESPPNVPHPLPLAESGMHPSPRSPGRSRHSPTRANLAKRSDAGPDIHQERSAARSPALYPDILVSPAWTSKRDKDPTSRSHANSPSLYESSGESRATPPSSPDRTRPPVRGHVAWTAPIDARIDAEVDTEFDTKVDTGVRSSGRKGNESHNMFWGSLSAPPSLEPVNRSAHDVSCSARCGGTAAPVYFREGHPFSESPLSSPNVSGTPAALARVGPNKPGASHSGAEFVFGHSEDFENRLVSPAATAGLLTGGSSRRPATHEYELESGSVSSNEDRFVDCESYRSSSPIARNAPEASAVHTQPARCAHYESEEQEQFPNDRENRPDSPIIGTESQVTMSPSRAGRAAGSLYTESASEIAPAHPFPEPAREHAIANHNLALYNEAVASVREEREALMQRLRDDFCMRASGPTIASVVGIRAKIPPPVRKSVIFRRLKELQEEKIRARARIDQVEQSPPPATSDPPSGGCSRAPLKMPRRMPSFFKRVSGAASSPREAEVEVKVEAEAKVKAEAKMERSAEMEPTQPSRKRACHASSMIPVPAGARDYYAQLCKRQRRNESEAAAASEAAGGSNPHLPRKVALDRRAALGPPLRRRSARLMEKAMASARPDTGSARHSGAESAEVQPPSPSRISPAACATGTRSRGKRITQRASARPVASRRVRPRGMQIVGKVSTRPEMKPHPPASQRLPSRKGQKKGRSQKAATGKASRIKGAVRTSVQAASSSRGSRPRSRTRRSKGSIVPVGSRTSVGRLPVARRTSSLESAEYADISTAQSPAADESAAEGQSPSHRARESPYAVGTDIDFGAELESSKPDMNEGSMERILSSVCADRPIDDEYGDPIVPGGAGGADSTGTVADHADNFGEYFEDVIDLLFETETDYTPSIKNLEGCLGSRDHRIRGYLVDWMLDIYTRLKLRPESFYLSVNMVDRCLALGKYTPDQYQLTAIACLFIAAKYESSSVPAIKFFVAVTGGKCTARDIIQAEAEILQILDYKLNAPNPMYMLRLCLKAYAGIPDMRSLSRYLLDLCTLSSSFQGIVPSAIAATSVNLAKIILFPDDWDTKFEFDQLRKYDYEKLSPYMEILIGILRERKLHGNFMRKYAVGRYAAINEKVEDFLNECISVM